MTNVPGGARTEVECVSATSVSEERRRRASVECMLLCVVGGSGGSILCACVEKNGLLFMHN